MLSELPKQLENFGVLYSDYIHKRIKELAIKPKASVTDENEGLWSDKSISKLSSSGSADGVIKKGDAESEATYEKLQSLMVAAQPVDLKLFNRGSATSAIASGKYVIVGLSRTDPAGDESTYSVNFESSGKVTIIDSSAVQTA